MIRFWKVSAEYGCLSNFSKHPITVDGKVYMTTEHYYQSRKFLDPLLQEQVRIMLTPKSCKTVAHQLTEKNQRPDWHQVKYEVMKDALRFKAKQHPIVLSILLGTGSEILAEASLTDAEWGLGPDGNGRNLLGKAWMEIRDELRTAGSLDAYSVAK